MAQKVKCNSQQEEQEEAEAEEQALLDQKFHSR